MTSFADSYLGRLRALIGPRLVLMPGARVICENAAGEILVIKRGDFGQWSMPAGSAEEGQSIEQTARQELLEETGLIAETMIPFGHASDPVLDAMHYPNGDKLQAFAMMFHCERWSGEARADGDESLEVAWIDPMRLPDPHMDQLRRTRDAFLRYKSGGGFQMI